MNGLLPEAATLASFFAVLSCSPERARRPNKDENPEERMYVDGGGGKPAARTAGSVAVERAVLSSVGDEADLVHARVGHRGPWAWPRCSLLERPAVEAGGWDHRP